MGNSESIETRIVFKAIGEYVDTRLNSILGLEWDYVKVCFRFWHESDWSPDINVLQLKHILSVRGCPREMEDSEVQSIFCVFDDDFNGITDVHEIFALMIMTSLISTHQRIRKLFQIYDFNTDGLLDKKEMLVMLGSILRALLKATWSGDDQRRREEQNLADDDQLTEEEKAAARETERQRVATLALVEDVCVQAFEKANTIHNFKITYVQWMQFTRSTPEVNFLLRRFDYNLPSEVRKDTRMVVSTEEDGMVQSLYIAPRRRRRSSHIMKRGGNRDEEVKQPQLVKSFLKKEAVTAHLVPIPPQLRRLSAASAEELSMPERAQRITKQNRPRAKTASGIRRRRPKMAVGQTPPIGGRRKYIGATKQLLKAKSVWGDRDQNHSHARTPTYSKPQKTPMMDGLPISGGGVGGEKESLLPKQPRGVRRSTPSYRSNALARRRGQNLNRRQEFRLCPSRGDSFDASTSQPLESSGPHAIPRRKVNRRRVVSGFPVGEDNTFVSPLKGTPLLEPKGGQRSRESSGGSGMAIPSSFRRRSEYDSARRKQRERTIKHIDGRRYTKKDIMMVKSEFEQMDIDCSGEVSFEEMLDKLSRKVPEEWIKPMFEIVDKDGNGKVTLKEMLLLMFPNASSKDVAHWKRWLEEEKPRNEEKEKSLMKMTHVADSTIKELTALFKIYDQDGNGSLSVEELMSALEGSNVIERKDVYRMLDEANHSFDDAVDLKAFIEIFGPVTERKFYDIQKDLGPLAQRMQRLEEVEYNRQHNLLW